MKVNSEIVSIALTYISYVKERYPSVHEEADGTPSIEQTLTEYLNALSENSKTIKSPQAKA